MACIDELSSACVCLLLLLSLLFSFGHRGAQRRRRRHLCIYRPAYSRGSQRRWCRIRWMLFEPIWQHRVRRTALNLAHVVPLYFSCKSIANETVPEVGSAFMPMNPGTPHRTMADAVRFLSQTVGYGAFFRGITPTLISVLPYSAVQFYAFETLTRALMEQTSSPSSSQQQGSAKERKPSVSISSVCGLAAGALAKGCTHPLDVVKKRFQVSGLPRTGTGFGAPIHSGQYANMWDCIRKVRMEPRVTHHGCGRRDGLACKHACVYENAPSRFADLKTRCPDTCGWYRW